MLVLSRRMNERIVIDGRITITVVQVKGDTVRLSFEAPRDVVIHREEIQRRLQGARLQGTRLEQSGELQGADRASPSSAA